jgi:uncharacterized membrane protein
MKEERDYIRDISEIRTMMERSSKFVSLSGWAGIMAGIYALLGAYFASATLGFNLGEITSSPNSIPDNFQQIILLGLGVLALAICTAILFSIKKAKQNGEKLWNATAKRVVVNMAVPLIAGGLLVLILISQGLIALIAPVTLLFYGMALFNAGKFTYDEVKTMGLVQIALGLLAAYFTAYGLVIWAFGFGVVHIVYGIFMHFKYER